MKQSIDDHKDWPLVVDLAVFFLTNLPHTRSGYTPCELHYGTTTPNIISTLKSFWIWQSSSPINISDFMLTLQHSISSTLQCLKSELVDIVVTDREKSTLRIFKPNDLV